MTKIDQGGWKFQPYEDNGFYILQVGGPLSAVIEQHGATWRLLISHEEGSDEPLIVQEHHSLAAAQAAAAPAMLALLDMWRNQLVAFQRKKKR